jgi:hypothetical protein
LNVRNVGGQPEIQIAAVRFCFLASLNSLDLITLKMPCFRYPLALISSFSMADWMALWVVQTSSHSRRRSISEVGKSCQNGSRFVGVTRKWQRLRKGNAQDKVVHFLCAVRSGLVPF